LIYRSRSDQLFRRRRF